MNVNRLKMQHQINVKKCKFLLIQTAFLGDVILTTPLIRAIKQKFPRSELHVLVIPETAMLLKHNPYIDKLLVFDKRKKYKKLFTFIQTIARLGRQQYDLAFAGTGSLTTALLMLMSRIPRRIGFANQAFLTDRVQKDQSLHTRERYVSLLSPLVDLPENTETEMIWSSRDAAAVDTVLKSWPTSEYRIGMAPGSVWPTKRWPAEYYAELIRLLQKKNVQIFLFGGRGEHELCENISRGSESPVINLAGELSLLQSAALIDRLDLLVCNDSAPLHLANAVNTPVFAFFGPTVKEFGFYPYRPHDRMLEIPDLYCRPCSPHGTRRCPQGHFRCMLEQKPASVARQILNFLHNPAESNNLLH